jgi:sugar O-acyltransferase (sialic acid O-acetyltransferase NeuD family)
MDRKQKLILLGAGGHARVVLGLAHANGLSILGVCDPRFSQVPKEIWNDIPVLGNDDILNELDPNTTTLLNGIGLMPHQTSRTRLQARWEKSGFRFLTMVHPAAWTATDIDLGEGVQVMAGAVLQPGCSIGSGSIINTAATIDHDCNIGQQVHIAPGVTVCGDVSIGDGAFIGAGATIINGTVIGERAFVKAGVIQTDHLPDDAQSEPAVTR